MLRPVLVALVLMWIVATACAAPAPPTPSPPSASGARTGPTNPPAPSAVTNDRLRALIDGAGAEGGLDLVWGENTLAGAAGVERLIRAFNEYYGLNLPARFTPGPSQPQVASTLVAEYTAGRPATTDVYIGGSESYIAIFVSPTMTLEQVDWPALFDYIGPSFVAVDGAALQISSRLPGIVYNTQVVSPSEAPTSLAALLDPKWKGKLSTNPYLAFFDTLSDPSLWGIDRTRQYVTALSPQLAGLIRCGEYERVANREFPVYALACTQGAVQPFVEQGAPLAYVIPSDAPLITHRYVGVPKHARHPNAAKLFAAFFLTPIGQQFLWDVDYEDHHGVPGTHNYQVVNDLKARGVEPIDISVERVMSFPVLDYASELQKLIQQ